MADDKLIEYIKSALASNTPIEQIKQNLLGAGWAPKQVDEAINFISPQGKIKGKLPLWVIGVVAVMLVGIIVFVFVSYSGLFQTTPPVTSPSTTQTSEVSQPTMSTPTDNTSTNNAPVNNAPISNISVSQGNGSIIQFVSCGNDIDCFINQSSTCNPSNLTYSISFDASGFIQNETTYSEIRGLSLGTCILYSKIIDMFGAYSPDQIQIFLSQNMTNDQINQQEQQMNIALSSRIGEDGICYYPISDLVQQFSGIKMGTYTGSAGDIQTYNCSGSLYNLSPPPSSSVTVSGTNTTSNSTGVLATP